MRQYYLCRPSAAASCSVSDTYIVADMNGTSFPPCPSLPSSYTMNMSVVATQTSCVVYILKFHLKQYYIWYHHCCYIIHNMLAVMHFSSWCIWVRAVVFAYRSQVCIPYCCTCLIDDLNCVQVKVPLLLPGSTMSKWHAHYDPSHSARLPTHVLLCIMPCVSPHRVLTVHKVQWVHILGPWLCLVWWPGMKINTVKPR